VFAQESASRAVLAGEQGEQRGRGDDGKREHQAQAMAQGDRRDTGADHEGEVGGGGSDANASMVAVELGLTVFAASIGRVHVLRAQRRAAPCASGSGLDPARVPVAPGDAVDEALLWAR